MLCQVRIVESLYPSRNDRVIRSYDLDLDTRLAEETTVLVETYTVPFSETILRVVNSLTGLCSYLMAVSLRSAKNGSRHRNACSNHIS